MGKKSTLKIRNITGFSSNAFLDLIFTNLSKGYKRKNPHIGIQKSICYNLKKNRIHNYVKQCPLTHHEFVPGLCLKQSCFTVDEVGGDDFQPGHSSIQH